MNTLRDLALIVLAAEAFIAALVPLALAGGLVYGMWWLMRPDHLPAWMRLAQAYLALGLAYVELAASMLARPVFAVHSALATVRGWLGKG